MSSLYRRIIYNVYVLFYFIFVGTYIYGSYKNISNSLILYENINSRIIFLYFYKAFVFI